MTETTEQRRTRTPREEYLLWLNQQIQAAKDEVDKQDRRLAELAEQCNGIRHWRNTAATKLNGLLALLKQEGADGGAHEVYAGSAEIAD